MENPKFNFDDKVFVMRIRPMSPYEFDSGIMGLGYLGTVIGIKQMKSGQIFYTVQARQWHLFFKKELDYRVEEFEVPAQFVFSSSEEMVKELMSTIKRFTKS